MSLFDLLPRIRIGFAASLTVLVLVVAASILGGSHPTAASASEALAAPVAPAPTTAHPPAPASVVASTASTVRPDLYSRAAGTCPGLGREVLLAIHEVETRKAKAAGMSVAGAVGPMQFLPATWRAYGVDADGDGHADVRSLTDAVFGAAHYLCANGGGDPATLSSALWHYNHSNAYVALVLRLAAEAQPVLS